MVSAYVLSRCGGSDDLSSILALKRSLTMPKPQNDEALIKHKAIGVNYFDIEAMRGDYGPTPPFVPGIEVVGVIEAKGKELVGFDVGDRVAYCSLGTGGFAHKSIVKARNIVKIPAFITDEVAAAGYLKGMIAMMLLTRVFMVSPGMPVVVWGAAGGVGHILTQFAKSLGCSVIGIVGSLAKAAHAEGNGCDLVIDAADDSMMKQVLKFSSGFGDGASVVYDPIHSKDTVAISHRLLSPFGLYAAYGQISTDIPRFSCRALQKKSLFVTRPMLFHYYARKFDMQTSAAILFDMIKDGKLLPKINNAYSFSDIPKAYTALAKRKLCYANVIVV